MSLAELRTVVNDAVLDMIGELERYAEFPKIKFRTEKDFRTVCKKASRLLNKLKVRGVTNGDLSYSVGVNEYVQALRTLSDEAKQENIDTAVVKIEYKLITKRTQKVIDMLTEYYVLNGPESKKDSVSLDDKF